MITSKEALKRLLKVADYLEKSAAPDIADEIKKCVFNLESDSEVLEIVKEHILDRKIDSSGIYLEYHQGYYEPYYTIEVKEGVKQVITEVEVKLLKEWLENENCKYFRDKI